MAHELWGSKEIPSELTLHNSDKGKIWWGNTLCNYHKGIRNDPDSLSLYPDYLITKSLLDASGNKPDFYSSTGNIRYTHRSLPDREIYFISNKTGSTITDFCVFRDGSHTAELWDAVTGEIKSLSGLFDKDRRIGVKVKLDPFQSYFIVFYKEEKADENEIKETENFPEKQVLMTLNGPWDVSFDTTWGGPGISVFDTLIDWSKRPEDGIKFYSGIAVYSKTFSLPENTVSINKSDIYIDLGKVKNLARVKINGKDLGVIWTAPWQVNITDMVKNKNNHLEIEVANLWINRLIGDESEPWDGIENGKWPEWLINGTQRPSKRYTFTTHRYYKKNDPLAESGLLGPVQIEKTIEER
jgi:hypothetical protein